MKFCERWKYFLFKNFENDETTYSHLQSQIELIDNVSSYKNYF